MSRISPAHTALEPLIHVEHLSVRYSASPALQHISFSVFPGEFILITGPSGCGKSTLGLALAGLLSQLSPTQIEGCLLIAGKELLGLPPGEASRLAGIVFQNPSLQLFNQKVEEEIAFGPRNLGLSPAEIARRVEQAVEGTSLTPLIGRPVRELSGGEKQKVAIASTLAMQPAVLILDEPTAHLDRLGIETIVETLARLNRELGITIILIEHRLHPFVPFADRVLVLEEGRLIRDGLPAAVLGNIEDLKRLGIRNPWYPVGPHCDLRPPVGIHPRRAMGTPLVQLQGIHAGYRRRQVLHGIDLELFPGEFTALIGDNGAGKSTVARLLAGILRPNKGKVLWTDQPQYRRRRPPVGLLFQNVMEQLLCDTVWEEIALAAENYGNPPSIAEEASRVAGLDQLLRRHPYTLSMGQMQRTALAANLSAAPQLLILDEPTVGQDWRHLSRLMEALKRLHARGHSILLITHDEKLIYRYAQRIVVMDAGVICADGPPRSREPAPTSASQCLSIKEPVPLSEPAHDI